MIAEARFLVFLDLLIVYYQFEVARNNRSKNAFSTPVPIRNIDNLQPVKNSKYILTAFAKSSRLAQLPGCSIVHRRFSHLRQKLYGAPAGYCLGS